MNFIKHLQEFQLMITCYRITYLHSLQESSDFIVLFMSISESNTRFSVKQLDALRKMIVFTILIIFLQKRLQLIQFIALII